MSITKAIEAYLKSTVDGCDEFNDWLEWKIGDYFGEDFVSDLKKELEELEEDEEPSDVIVCNIDYALADLKQEFEGSIEELASESADSDARVIYTNQYIDYFLKHSRCEEICEEQGLVSTPSDPYSHMQQAVYLAIEEELTEELNDNFNKLDYIFPDDIAEAIDWSDVIATQNESEEEE